MQQRSSEVAASAACLVFALHAVPCCLILHFRYNAVRSRHTASSVIMDASKVRDQAAEIGKTVEKAAEKTGMVAPRGFTSDPSMMKDRLTMEPPAPFRADECTIARAAANFGNDYGGDLP